MNIERWSAVLRNKLTSVARDSGRGSDLTIIGKNEKKFKVHRFILSLWSPVLEEEISRLTTASSTLIFHEVDGDAMKSFLKFIYMGEIEDQDPNEFKKSLELFKTAVYFQCTELVDLCAQFMKPLLNDKNVLIVFQTAMTSGHKTLIYDALDYINKNGDKVLESDEFRDLPLDCAFEIIKQDDLKVSSELKVFDAVHRWGTAECFRQKLDAGDPLQLRTVLDKLIKWIRFPLMIADEYTMNVAPKGLLKKSELDSLLSYFMTSEQKRSTLPENAFITKARARTDNGTILAPNLPKQESKSNPKPYKPHLLVQFPGDPVRKILYDVLPNDIPQKLKEMLLEKFKYPICCAVEGGTMNNFIPFIDRQNPTRTLHDFGIKNESIIYLSNAPSVNDKPYCGGCYDLNAYCFF